MKESQTMTPAEFKAQREEMGMSQALLADHLGFTTNHIAKMERAVSAIPRHVAHSMAMLARLSLLPGGVDDDDD